VLKATRSKVDHARAAHDRVCSYVDRQDQSGTLIDAPKQWSLTGSTCPEDPFAHKTGTLKGPKGGPHCWLGQAGPLPDFRRGSGSVGANVIENDSFIRSFQVRRPHALRQRIHWNILISTSTMQHTRAAEPVHRAEG
jgi:hypothetical protein